MVIIQLHPSFAGKVWYTMNVKYINYNENSIYALYYIKGKILYYNLNFDGRTKIYLLI